MAFKHVVVVSQCMRLPLLNAFKEKTGQSPATQLPTPALPSFDPIAFV
jgi:hypothetical protein